MRKTSSGKYSSYLYFIEIDEYTVFGPYNSRPTGYIKHWNPREYTIITLKRDDNGNYIKQN